MIAYCFSRCNAGAYVMQAHRWAEIPIEHVGRDPNRKVKSQ